MKTVLNILLLPIRSQSLELLTLEIQILRLVFGFVWLITTIGISLSSISFESKLILIMLGSLTVIVIMLRSFRLAEARKSRQSEN